MQPSESSRLRLMAGLRGDRAHGASGSRRPFFGEPVIWDRLFPRGRGRLWRLCLPLAAVVAVGVMIGLTWGGGISSFWGSAPSGGTPGGTPGDGNLPGETEIGGGEETTDGVDASTDAIPEVSTTAEPDTDPAETDLPEGDASPSETTGSPHPGGEENPETAPRPDEGETTSPAETIPPSDGEIETLSPEEGETASPLPIPDGCYPIVGVDMSQSEQGVGYLVGETDSLPATLLPDRLWTGEAPPTVLIIHTHPYEGYGDGKAWYDPAAGSLALTETPHASEGVVALGAALARELRGLGATVVHLRIAVAATDTAAEIYDRTEAAVRNYCTLYPDIGLVIDLRRSAEMTAVTEVGDKTEAGGVLRTEGILDGETCAQVRISVSAGRGEAALAGDLTLALALRERMWRTEPTLSRPVRVKAGGGVDGDLSRVRMLTLELGAAGNTYAEAERLIIPLAEALAEVLR